MHAQADGDEVLAVLLGKQVANTNLRVKSI